MKVIPEVIKFHIPVRTLSSTSNARFGLINLLIVKKILLLINEEILFGWKI